ncbi:transposase [Candidatus Methanoperedens nitroreducens]|uniref:Transposase n=1 Tax=Candidatus Methanoperedens nitratireducens TaxID=1392998 RepID=A0A062UW51_9EURY|nr:IS3 family transposase [Candidatus Methanoperedens nitroreducens]KCZ71246.1 transposase [Candidatus Methanoperedens nitroreducens]MDJ1420328.1 IS3 family transposase [Candidatus Methanoperedens sp.]
MEFARNEVSLGVFSINRICSLCGISKATFYNHKSPDERFEEKYIHVKKLVQEVIKDNSAYGIKRIKAALKDEYDTRIGRDALARLLKLWGLNLKRKIRKHKISLIKKILISLSDRVNLLIRTNINAPFQALTSDITEIYYNQGKSKAYLAIHKDVFGQMVYGWCLQEKMDAKIVIISFERAIKKIKEIIKKIPENLLCHQDQGSQYTSYEYTDTVMKNGVILSYSTPGTPTENPGQESFFGRLKDECQDEIDEIKDFKNLERFIKRRIEYYNRKRIHTSINYEAPLKFTNNFIKNISLT